MGLLWNMQMLSGTGAYENNSDGRPELLIRNGFDVYFRYSAFGDRWFMGNSGMVRTEGGVDFSSVGGGWEVPMPRGEWHTVRLQTYPGAGQMGWEIWVDEMTDDSHHMKGYTTTTTGSSYVQWGVLSSDRDAVFATNYFYWSQGDAITPIPEPAAMVMLVFGGLCLLRRPRLM